MPKLKRLFFQVCKWGRYTLEARDKSALDAVRTVDLDGYRTAPNKLEDFLRCIGPADTSRLLDDAKSIRQGRFVLLGHEPIQSGIDVDWNLDYVNNYAYPVRYHKKIRLSQVRGRSDVKNVWELSRFHVGLVLGQAYLISQDASFAEVTHRLLASWMRQNPYGRTVNWKTAMEVALRACNWLAMYAALNDYLAADSVFHNRLLQMLYLHGIHVLNNLELGPTTNNHFLSNLIGLIWLGIFFDGVPTGPHRAWLNYSQETLVEELDKQIHPDGTDFEASTAYHLFVTELLVYTLGFARAMQVDLPEPIAVTAEAMLRFLLDLRKPDHDIPLIGDNDGGRFLCPEGVSSSRSEHLAHIVQVAGKLFPQLGGAITHCDSYPDSGYYILRNRRVYVLIRCGPVGTGGNGGHSHNDQLSLCINLDGHDFVIDPGLNTYTLDPDLRNFHRSTQAHSVIYLDGYEQNNFAPDKLFRLQETHEGVCLDKQTTRFAGRFCGYRDKAGLIHKRDVELKPDGLMIRDHIERHDNREVPVQFRLVLHPEVRIIRQGDEVELCNGPVRVRIKPSDHVTISATDIKVADDYGSMRVSKQLQMHAIPDEFTLSLDILSGLDGSDGTYGLD